MDKSIMWHHIAQETEVLPKLLADNQVKQLAGKCDLKKLRKLIFVASGSSLNVASVAEAAFAGLANVEVVLKTPFNFLADPALLAGSRPEETLVIAISQTGTSSGTIQAIHQAKTAGHKVLTMTEQVGTPVHTEGDYYLNFLCGPENCNAKTKGYSSSLVLLWLLALEIGCSKGIVNEIVYQEFRQEIADSISDIPETINHTLQWLETHKDWAAMEYFLVVGNGINYGTAEEGMLKLLETLCIPAYICETGEFSHGFHRTLNSRSNVILLLTEEYGNEDIKKAIGYLKPKIRRLLVIDASRHPVPDVDNIPVTYRFYTASALNIAVVFQVMAVALPEILGYDPNEPVNEDFTKLVGTR